MSEPDFEVLGKVVNPLMGGDQYVCMINGQKWWVPDDMDNADRQRVQVWIDTPKPVPELTPEEAAAL